MAVDGQVDQLLRQAIAGKHLVRFSYKGSERIAEPHDYGIQNSNVRLLCWQVGGKSNARLPGWRLVDVDGIEKFEVLERTFAGNSGVSEAHHRWDEIFIRVAPPEGSKIRKIS
jgi:hypothetical protein